MMQLQNHFLELQRKEMKKMYKARKYNFNGEMLTIKDAVRKYNPKLSYNIVYGRIHVCGLTPTEALQDTYEYTTRNPAKSKKYNFNGEMLSLRDAIEKYNPGMNYSTLYSRINVLHMDPFIAVKSR